MRDRLCLKGGLRALIERPYSRQMQAVGAVYDRPRLLRQSQRDRWLHWLLVAVIAQIPFELGYTLLGLSNLQWTFFVLAVLSIPVLLDRRSDLIKNRLIQAAALFAAVQWLAAFLAPEFQTNAMKGAARFTAGWLLLAVGLVSERPSTLVLRGWTITAAIAAVYGLADYAGVGAPWLFREGEFYIGQVQRLSASFEYPNTAAAYFAMSIPVVWWTDLRPSLKWPLAFLLWSALILTFSRGALAAVVVIVLAAVVVSRSKAAAGLIAAGTLAYIAVLPVNPYLFERLRNPGARNPLAAEYRTAWNSLRQRPEATDSVQLQIRNTGVSKWRANGWRQVAVSYRWWDRETESFLRSVAPIVTKLPHDVEPGNEILITASFHTPRQPGYYILVFELFSRNFDWFSQTGVIPTLIQVDLQHSVERSTGHADLSSLYRRGQSSATLTSSVPRSSLWRAALKMFVSHPLGVGPDNYRLQYGRYLGAARWDTGIYSNNLYLEILTGSGVLGLAAFGLIALAVPWRIQAAQLGVAVFLLHGMVDVFLMTTPIYFSFWILLGLSNFSPVGAVYEAVKKRTAYCRGGL